MLNILESLSRLVRSSRSLSDYHKVSVTRYPVCCYNIHWRLKCRKIPTHFTETFMQQLVFS